MDALSCLRNNSWKRNNPAIVRLPPATGTCQLIGATPFFLESGRVLLITPDRHTSRFYEANLFPSDAFQLPLPVVKRIDDFHEGAFRRIEDMCVSDVVITLSSNISATDDLELWHQQQGLPKKFFDLVMVADAHHLPPQYWRALVYHFSASGKLVFFTASTTTLDGRIDILEDINADGAQLLPPGCMAKLLYNDLSLLSAAERSAHPFLHFNILFDTFTGD